MIVWTKKILLSFLCTLIITLPVNATTFAVYGDSRGDDIGVNSIILTKIVNQLVKIKPAFHLFVGDLINGDNDIEIQKKQLSHWMDIMKPILENKNIYITFGGTHDITSKEKEQLLKESVEQPLNGPEELKELCYSFDYENIHIICLDSSMPEKPHSLGEKQLKWLVDDLDKTNKENIFVFSHEPAFPILRHTYKALDKFPDERDKFWDILVKYKVDAYFCGHEHLYNCRIIKGIPQIILGGAGAPVYRGAGGEFYHYAIVDVQKDGFTISIYDENGQLRDTISRDNKMIEMINNKILENKKKKDMGVNEF